MFCIKRMTALAAVFMMIFLSACGSLLRECQFSEPTVERLSYDGVNFNLILAGSGTTAGAVFDDSEDGIPLAPDFRTMKNFVNTGGPYIQQAYTSLEPGTYRVNVWGSRDRTSREIRLQSGTSVMLQAECP